MKSVAIELKWAGVFTLMMICWMTLEMLLGFHSTHIEMHPIVTNFVAIPAIAIYVLAIRQKRIRFYHGTMTFMQGFVSGIVMTTFITLLTPLTIWLSVTVISPHFFQNMKDYANAHNYSSPEALETYFSLNSYLLQGVIGAMVMGTLTSLVVAALAKRGGKKELPKH